MPSDYMGHSDAGTLAFLKNFLARLRDNPGRYALSHDDASNLGRVVDAYDQTLAVLESPESRTPNAVRRKEEAKAIAVQLCRQMAMLIKMNAGIPNDVKAAIGVRPVNHTRHRIPTPTTRPVLNLVGSLPPTHTLRYHDALAPTRRAKPYGVTLIQLFLAIADAPATHWDQARLVQTTGERILAVSFGPEQDGKVATYFACWATAGGLVGPLSDPVSSRIAVLAHGAPAVQVAPRGTAAPGGTNGGKPAAPEPTLRILAA